MGRTIIVSNLWNFGLVMSQISQCIEAVICFALNIGYLTRFGDHRGRREVKNLAA